MNQKILIIPIIIAISLVSFFLLMNYNEQSQLNEIIFFPKSNVDFLKVNDVDYVITHYIKNGTVTDMWYSKDMNSLNLKLDTSDDGEISLIIPQGFFHYPEVNQGEMLMIIHNGEEIFSVDSSDEINHIVQFNFTHPDPTIEVIGTFIP